MRRRSWRKWSHDEDDLIREYYPLIGARWNGWAKLMPERMPTYDDIAHRAMAIGVRCNRMFRYGKGKAQAIERVNKMLKERLGTRET